MRKVETYDSRYRSLGDAYEWAMPTGGHGLRFASPRLVLTARPATRSGTTAVTLPAPLDAAALFGTADDSRPTAVLPAPAEIIQRARRAVSFDGKGREDWEIERVRELRRVGGDRVSNWGEIDDEAGYKAYEARLREVLAIPPRYWQGWTIQDDLLAWHLFRDLIPPPVQDHMKAYWRAWLQPDLPTEAFVHPQSRDAIDYWKRNRDWRGRASFFRDGYNYVVSTQNFNHTAAMGALLGGAMIDGAYPMADGRHGLEALPLRFWSFLDGSTQEMLDHYYLSITLSAQKMFADFAPTRARPADGPHPGRPHHGDAGQPLSSHAAPLRRLFGSGAHSRRAGRAGWHLRRAAHRLPEGRGELPRQAGLGEGAGHAGLGLRLPAGARGDADAAVALGADLGGRPHRPQARAIRGDLGGDDARPLQAALVATLLSRALARAGQHRHARLTVDLLGQWVRRPLASAGLEDLGTLTARYVANGPDLATTRGGVTPQAGLLLTYQSRNRAIVFAKPHSNRERFLAALGKEDVSRLATVIGLWNFDEPRHWEIFAGATKVDSFPHRAAAGERILIRDGVSYLAILPLPASDLGRDAEIEIAPGIAGKVEPTGAAVAPALTISLFNLRRDAPIAVRDLDLAAINTRTYGGFVLEMGDIQQHGSFEGFVRHIGEAELKAEWNDEKRQLDVAYRSGGDLMEAGFTSDFSQPPEDYFPVRPGAQERAIPYRRLNGAVALPAGRAGARHHLGATGHQRPAGEERQPCSPPSAAARPT